jgi:hypothetical protein
MGSLDLTAAFDVVNIDLLIKRLKNLGLPEDWMELLAAWLRDRAAFLKSQRTAQYFMRLTSEQFKVQYLDQFSSAFLSHRFLKKQTLWPMQMTPTQSHQPEQKKMRLPN